MKKRTYVSFLCLVMLFSLLVFSAPKAQAKTVAQGMCGDTTEWTLSDTGVLTIFGQGEIAAYSYESLYPWYAYLEDIKSLEIKSGVTNVPQYAFGPDGFADKYNVYRNLSSVKLAESVTEIGERAFYCCSNITNLSLSSGLLTIGRNAFGGALAMSKLVLPNSLQSIGEYAFSSNDTLTSVVLPNSLQSIGREAFSGCGLTSVVIPKSVKSIGSDAFAVSYYQDSNLSKIVFYNTVESLDFHALYHFTSATLYFYGTRTELDALFEVEPFYNRDAPVYCLSEPTITTQPNSISVKTGQTGSFSITAKGSSLKYQWQFLAPGSKTWKSWSTAKTISVKATGDRNGYKFRCKVTDAAGTVLTSKVVTFKETFGISVNPTSQSVYAKENAVFTVKAGGSGLSYNWQYSKDNGKTWSLWSRAREITVPAEGHRNGFLFRCTVSDNAGNSKTTKAVKLTVLTKITAQPKSVSAAKGETVKFTVKAEGPKLSYKWQFSKDGGKTWASWGTGNSISVVAAAGRNNYRFRCLITDANGTVTTSKAVKLTIK